MVRVLRSHTLLQRPDISIDYWVKLPPELRRMIFVFLLGPRVEGKRTDLSTYAAVCPEWKSFFERETFKHLTLHQSDIPELCSIVQGERKTFVRWIWLNIKLPKYNCDSCRKRESTEELKVHKFIFTNAVWNLFAFLSTWKKPGRNDEW